ncbi:hypothetical protein M9978_02310 [Sphingomonas sp. MG17]|uniref:Phage tail protein n=1 Tax=Sphingomonas tagetis TaxID=2949092 RepID=A0A9X2KJA4_9SPHN|nr:hypothetical protein [Sphingomonas tagetis]MCP3729249.1 hypothetical protein [Sphingomonas tagetis]
MSRPDAAASAALDAQVVRPVWFAYLDILGDPIRACTAARSITFTGIGDPDVDDQVFDAINPDVVEISSVRVKANGAEPVTARLSGIATIDADTLELIGDKSNWQGRVARLWRIIRDESGTQAGALQHYYTGYMVALSVTGTPQSQSISVKIESYLAAYSQASNRTYLDQEQYDPGDLSAKAAIAIANGTSGNPLISNTPVQSDYDDWRSPLGPRMGL